MAAKAEEAAATSGRCFQGVARNEFGYKMLQSMGWSEGKGLGASETGITKHISTVKRQEQIGIGADGRADSTAKVDWTVNTHTFDAILAGLSQHHGAADEKQARKRARRKEKAAAQGEVAAVPAAAPARGRPQGRYAKREAGKRVKGYSASDLSMILGVVPDAFASAPPPFVRLREDSDHSESDGQQAPQPQPSPAASKQEKKRKRRAEASVAEAAAAAAAEAAAAEEQAGAPPADWWGASMFAWAGRLGGVRQSQQKRGFDEEDQVNAFNAVHDGATAGKQGLGIKSLPPKVGGARWKGTKVSFGDAEQEEEEQGGEGAALSAVKWKKHAERVLRARPGDHTLRELLAHVLRAAGVAVAREADALAALSSRLLASSRFVVRGDAVRLATQGAPGEDE